MLGKQYSHFKGVIHQQGLQGTFSGITNWIRRGNVIATAAKASGGESKTLLGENLEVVPSDRSVHMVDLPETKRKFVSELLFTYFLDAGKKYPLSSTILFLTLDYALQIRQNELICIF